MKTFNCWLISNLEFILVIYLFIVIGGGSEIFQLSLPTNKTLATTLLIFSFIVTLSFAIYIAIYSWKNFDEVTSRRMLWRNSNAAIFQIKLAYVFSRFSASFFTIGIFFLIIL